MLLKLLPISPQAKIPSQLRVVRFLKENHLRKKTSESAAEDASKVLKDERTSKTSKTAAGSALTQRVGKTKAGTQSTGARTQKSGTKSTGAKKTSFGTQSTGAKRKKK